MSTTLLALVAAAVLAGCGSSGSDSAGVGGAPSDGVLTVAYQDSPTGGIDPDVFYGVEGQSIISSVYEGLVAYEPDSVELGPELATRWEIGDDGKTYTFTLREGVRFHDGTPFDSAAVKANFERRQKVDQAVAYLIADIARIETPAPDKVVVTLKAPNNAFLDNLASMYGPKMISPAAIRQHAGKDVAQKWLSENAVGTGPFRLDSFRIGDSFKLSRNEAYWGEKAGFAKVDIRVIPDLGTQRLQLSSGDVDLMTHGIDAANLPSVESDSALTVNTFPATLEHVIYLNTHKAPFDDVEVRRAFMAALDPAPVVQAVYGKTGRAAISAYPASLSKDGKVGAYRKPEAKPLDRPVEIVMSYANGSGGSGLQQMAQHLQAQLKEAGFEVTLKGDTYAQEFAYATNLQKAPNVLLSGLNPDSAHPDSWATPVWTTGGGLNLLGYSNTQVDELVAKARAAATPEQADALYDELAQLVQDDAAVLTLDDTDEVVVARKGITGFVHTPAYIWQVDLAALREE